MDSVIYHAQITIYVVENGIIVKDGNPESVISKMWIAKTKEDLAEVVTKIAEKFLGKF